MFKILKRKRKEKKKTKTIYYKEQCRKYKGEVNDIGEPHGYGILYDKQTYRYDDGYKNIVYQGYWLNGKFDGQGTHTKKDPNWRRNIIQQGTFKGGNLMEGSTMYVSVSGDFCTKYTGSYENGEIIHGDYINNNHLVYRGKFKDRQFHGEGTQYQFNGNILYVGEHKAGKYHGKGILYNSSNHILFEGTFHEGEYQIGKFYSNNGALRYEGSFLNKKYDGYGKLYKDDGTLTYVGDFIENYGHGIGEFYYPDGKTVKYKGSVRKGLPHGIGTYYEVDGSGIQTIYNNGNRQFECQQISKDGVLNGVGKEYLPDGKIKYEGNFVNSQYTGYGKLYQYNKDGSAIIEGELINGVFNGIIKEYDIYNRLCAMGNCINGQKEGEWKFLNKRDVVVKRKYKNGKHDPTSDIDIMIRPNGYDRYIDDYAIDYELPILNKPVYQDDNVAIQQRKLMMAIHNITFDNQTESINRIREICSNLNTLDFGYNHLTNPLTAVCVSDRFSNTFNTELAKLFIELGANINYRSTSGATPILYMVQAGNVDMVKYMIEKGADYKVFTHNKYGIQYFANESGVPNMIEYVSTLIDLPNIGSKLYRNNYGFYQVATCDCDISADSIFECAVHHK